MRLGGLPFAHEAVNYSAKESFRAGVPTTGIETFRSVLKRGYHGTYRKTSRRPLQRDVNGFAGRTTCAGATPWTRWACGSRGWSARASATGIRSRATACLRVRGACEAGREAPQGLAPT